MGNSAAQNGMEKGTAVRLKTLVRTAQDAVVSRTLLKNSAGTITVFAFDGGQGLSEHSAPFDAFVQCVEGEAEITVGGKPQNVSAGDILVMPANVPHSLRALKKFKMLLVMIRGA